MTPKERKNPEIRFRGSDNQRILDLKQCMKENTIVEKNNNSSWRVHEYLRHKNYGIGQIIEIVGDILVVDFKEHGVKKILSYYAGLEKVNVREVEL